jgi:hypothetical protein
MQRKMPPEIYKLVFQRRTKFIAKTITLSYVKKTITNVVFVLNLCKGIIIFTDVKETLHIYA